MVAMVGGGTAKGVDWAATIRGISLWRIEGLVNWSLVDSLKLSQAESATWSLATS